MYMQKETMAKISLELDEESYKKLQERAKNEGYNSVEEMLRSLVDKLVESSEEWKEEEEEVKKKLRKLGYF